MKLIVVGDTHIDEKLGEKRGVDTAVRLAQLVAHVNVHHADAVGCLFVGDLTHKGDVGAYKRFRQLIEPLAVPPLLMIGNHDHRGNFQAVFPQAHRDDDGFVQFVLDLGDDYRLIALDSLNAPPYEGAERHVGVLCEKRLAFLEAALQTAVSRTVIIAMHHQPFCIGLPGMDVIRLWNGEAFMKVIGRFPNVKMLLMGHNHRTISGVVRGLPFSCFRSLSVQTPLDFGAVDPSGGITEPPGYGVLLLGDDSILVHQEEFMAGVEAVSNWQEILQNEPEVAEEFGQLVAKMLPERAGMLEGD